MGIFDFLKKDHRLKNDLRTSENSSNIYKYMGLTVVARSDNTYSTVISLDVGYRPLLLYRDHLINELGFTLENEYGITDMTQEYSYKGNSYSLVYWSYDLDMIMFNVHAENEKIPKCFFETALYLKRLDISQLAEQS